MYVHYPFILIYICSLVIYIIFCKQFISLSHYVIGFFEFGGLIILSSLYILVLSPLSDVFCLIFL